MKVMMKNNKPMKCKFLVSMLKIA